MSNEEKRWPEGAGVEATYITVDPSGPGTFARALLRLHNIPHCEVRSGREVQNEPGGDGAPTIRPGDPVEVRVGAVGSEWTQTVGALVAAQSVTKPQVEVPAPTTKPFTDEGWHVTIKKDGKDWGTCHLASGTKRELLESIAENLGVSSESVSLSRAWTGLVVARLFGVKRIALCFAAPYPAERSGLECVCFGADGVNEFDTATIRKVFEARAQVMVVFGGRLLVGPMVDLQTDHGRVEFVVQGSL